MIYLYDETFNGLLTCIHNHYYMEKAQGIYPADGYQGDMLSRHLVVESDDEKASTVYDAIETKLSSFNIGRIYKVFGSPDENREMKILNYVRLGFKKGPGISLLHGNSIVHEVEKIEKKVNYEIHRMLGLIRFSVVHSQNSGDILYSPIEPDNDIVEYLAEHFTDRLKNDPFIIHDKKRSKALVYGSGEWYVTDFNSDHLLENTDEEENYRNLWKMYFDTIAIKERTNPRCQKNFMPVRYWKNLTEFKSTKQL